VSVINKTLEGQDGQGDALDNVDWLARARELAPMIAEDAVAGERAGQVTDRVMAAMHEKSMFRMALPRIYGGGAATALEMSQVAEIVAAADASTSWCLGQALGCTFASGYIDPEVANEIYGAPDAVLAWGPPGKSKAVKVDGGYRVSGEWRFASGSRHATWLGGHSRLYDDDDTPTKGPNGGPVIRTMMYPKSSATMIDVWQVIGLRATGSDNYAVKDLFVPASHTYARDSDAERRDTGPIHRIPLLTFYGMIFAGVALGIGRALLDEFFVLAETKVSGGATGPLRENAVIQSEVAQCEARLRSSRAFLHEMIEEYWENAKTGEPPSLPLRAQLRTSITWAMNQARDVANYAYHASGTNGIFENNDFERRFRDMHTVAQQGQGHRSNFEAAGQVFLGLQPTGHRV